MRPFEVKVVGIRARRDGGPGLRSGADAAQGVRTEGVVMPVGRAIGAFTSAASVVGVITRALLATGAAQQQPEADPQLEAVGERQVRTVRRRGGEDEPVRAGRPDGRQVCRS